ncbi:MAG: hypothetical protein EBR86_16465 [Planctomycetia bacterium]|nr:hypothetical protein [Planctomycetia bacterium]
MKATTVKLDGELLDQIEKAKAPGQSVTAYVRSVLRKNLEQQRLREASVAYRAFVEAHPDEREWLGEWERADLPTAPSDQRDAQ